MHACVLSHVHLLAPLWTVAHQAPLSTGFSRQECWSGLPFPPLRDLPNPEIESGPPTSPALAGRHFMTEPPDGQGDGSLLPTMMIMWLLLQIPVTSSKVGQRHAQHQPQLRN